MNLAHESGAGPKSFQLGRPQDTPRRQTSGLAPEHIAKKSDCIIQIPPVKRCTRVLDLALQTRIELIEELLRHD